MTLHAWQLKSTSVQSSWSNLVWLMSYACRIKQEEEEGEEDE